MEKNIPLKKLNTEEEYMEVNRKMDYYGGIYAWLKSDKEPVKTIESEVRDLANRLSSGDLSDEDRKTVLGQIQSLVVIRGKIGNDPSEYEKELESAITAYAVLAKQYENDTESQSFSDLIRGVLSGKIDLSEYIKKKRFVNRVNNSGLVNNPGYRIDVESPKKILNYILENYNLVRITKSPEETTALVKVANPNFTLGIEDEELRQELDEITASTIKGYTSSIGTDENRDSSLKPEINQNGRVPREQQVHKDIKEGKEIE